MKNKKVILNANSCRYLLNFRQNSIKTLISKGYKVYCLAPTDESSEKLALICTKYFPINFNKSSKNPFNELQIFFSFFWIFLILNPTVIFNFTIKNNIYGSLAGFFTGKKVVNNITGLGSAMLRQGFTRIVILSLYKLIKNIPHHTFCQNSDDFKFLDTNNLINSSKTSLLPGSGVDTKFFHPKFKIKKKVETNNQYIFMFIGRLIKDKGILELTEAFKQFSKSFPQARLHIIGDLDNYNPSRIEKHELDEMCNHPQIVQHGHQESVRDYLSFADCFVLPSYREGISRSMLEAMAMEIPVITTDVPGCRELIKNNENGILCESHSIESLHQALVKMIKLNDNDRMHFGARSRKLVTKKFEEKIVIDALLSAL